MMHGTYNVKCLDVCNRSTDVAHTLSISLLSEGKDDISETFEVLSLIAWTESKVYDVYCNTQPTQFCKGNVTTLQATRVLSTVTNRIVCYLYKVCTNDVQFVYLKNVSC